MTESIKIIENGFVVTCDGYNHIGLFAVLLKNERIAELNPSSDGFKARFPQAEIVDASDKVLFPGFIDPHFHGESFVLRNWTAGFPMAKWEKVAAVRKVRAYVYREASKEELVTMYRAAYFSALKSGITFLSEFGFDNLEAPFVAAREAMKRSDLKGFVGVHNGEQIEQARDLVFPGIRYAIVLPEEDDLTTYNLQTTLRLVSDLKYPIVSHLGETRRGFETLKKNFHKSIVRVLDEYKLFHQPLHLTHLACLDEGDDAILTKFHSPVIINSSSLLAKGAEIPPLGKFLEYEMPIALCSDWGVPDPFENMRSLNHVAKLAGASLIDPIELISAHTINAARALNVQDEVGSIEPGKRADITFLDISDLRLQQLLHYGNPMMALHNLFGHASSRDVSDVMINGEFFLRKRQVMTYAEEDLRREYREILEQLIAKTGMYMKESAAGELLPETPILPLMTNETFQEESPSELTQAHESFEEGFRIIGKTGSLKAAPEQSDPTKSEKPKTTELPKSARRIFGEEDS